MSTNNTITVPSSEEIQASILAAATAAYSNSAIVVFDQKFARSSAQSSRLTDLANSDNNTQEERSAKVNIKFMPNDFRKKVNTIYDWVKEPIISKGSKKPDTGKRPAYQLTLENQLFDRQFQEMEHRHDQYPDLIKSIIEDKVITFGRGNQLSGYGGWPAFVSECMDLAGDEINVNPDLFPYKNVDEFIEEFQLTYEAEIVDPAKNMAELTPFVAQLMQDNRISAATKMFHSVIGDAADTMAKAAARVLDSCPDQQIIEIQVFKRAGKGTGRTTKDKLLFTLNCDASEARKDGDAAVLIKREGKDEGFIPFKPMPRITDEQDSPISPDKLEGIARQIVARILKKPQSDVRFKQIPYKGGKSIESRTFDFLSEKGATLEAFVSPIPEGDFPVLHKAVEDYLQITEDLINLADKCTGKAKAATLPMIADMLPDMKANIEDFETVLV